jgi:hypothetical protein
VVAHVPFEGGLAGEPSRAEGAGAQDLADALRSAMSREYADASAQEMGDALEALFGSMTPAEAFNFSSALKQIGTHGSKLLSDPTFIQVASTAAPIVLGVAGTALGGPAGGALGAGLGNIAANALSARAARPPAAAQPTAAEPAPSAAAMPAPSPLPSPVVPPPVPSAPTLPSPEIPPPAPRPAPSIAGGSAAAARALVLAMQPDVLRSLLATALGRYGGKESSGLPVAQIVTLFSEAIGEAAADADELMYLGQHPDAKESLPEDTPAGSARSLYTELLGADNIELAEAAGLDGLGR